MQLTQDQFYELITYYAESIVEDIVYDADNGNSPSATDTELRIIGFNDEAIAAIRDWTNHLADTWLLMRQAEERERYQEHQELKAHDAWALRCELLAGTPGKFLAWQVKENERDGTLTWLCVEDDKFTCNADTLFQPRYYVVLPDDKGYCPTVEAAKYIGERFIDRDRFVVVTEGDVKASDRWLNWCVQADWTPAPVVYRGHTERD